MKKCSSSLVIRKMQIIIFKLKYFRLNIFQMKASKCTESVIYKMFRLEYFNFKIITYAVDTLNVLILLENSHDNGNVPFLFPPSSSS